MIASDELASIIGDAMTQTAPDSRALQIQRAVDALVTFQSTFARTYIGLEAWPGYIAALSLARLQAHSCPDLEVLDREALKTLCSLTLNVASQDRSQLQRAVAIVVPWLISSGQRDAEAGECLDAMWFASPDAVEESLREFGLCDDARSDVIITTLRRLATRYDELAGNFAFRKFTPCVVSLLGNKNADVRRTAYLLLVKVFSVEDPERRADLRRQLEAKNIPAEVRQRLLDRLVREASIPLPPPTVKYKRPEPATKESQFQNSAPLIRSETHPVHLPQTSKPASLVIPTTLPLPSSAGICSAHSQTNIQLPQRSQPRPLKPSSRNLKRPLSTTETSQPSPAQTPSSLGDLKLENLPPLQVFQDPAFPPQDLQPLEVTEKEFSIHIERTLAILDGPETDTNWSERQAMLVDIRRMMRAPQTETSKQIRMHAILTLSRGISKAITSLRTTLAVHSCHTVKDAYELLQSSEAVDTAILAALVKVAAGRKKITASIAHITICSLLMRTPPAARYFGFIDSAMVDLRREPRTYAMEWLQVLLISHPDLVQQKAPAANVERWLIKALADAAPQTRMAARATFWATEVVLPAISQRVRENLGTGAALRALDSSRPSEVPVAGTAGTTPPKSSPPVDSIVTSGPESSKKTLKSSEPASLKPRKIATTESTGQLQPLPQAISHPLVCDTPSPISSGPPDSAGSEVYSNREHIPDVTKQRLSAENGPEQRTSRQLSEQTKAAVAVLDMISTGEANSDIARSVSQLRPDLTPELANAAKRALSQEVLDSDVRECVYLWSKCQLPDYESLVSESQKKSEEFPGSILPSSEPAKMLKSTSHSEVPEAEISIQTPILHQALTPSKRFDASLTSMQRVYQHEFRVYQEPQEEVGHGQGIYVNQSQLKPLPADAETLRELLENLKDDISRNSASVESLTSLNVIMGSPSHRRSLRRDWAPNLLAPLLAYISSTSTIATAPSWQTSLFLSLLALQKVVPHLSRADLYPQVVAVLLEVASRSDLPLLVESEALPLIVRALVKVQSDAVCDAALRLWSPTVPAFAKVVLLRLLRGGDPSPDLIEQACSDENPCVRAEAYPIILDVYQRSPTAGKKLNSCLNPGQQRLLAYYRENLPNDL